MGAKYDVFISYRRDGGEQTARNIHDTLSAKGYHVFFDVESLRSGEFNKRLLDVIADSKDFILVLSPSALDRCSDEKDWVRQEIICAKENNKNIIPILLRGFDFPEKLPFEIDDIRWLNGLSANSEFYDAFIDRLCKNFLHSKPQFNKRIFNSKFWGKIIPVALIIGIFVIGIEGYRYINTVNKQSVNIQYPNTDEEKQFVDEALYYVSSRMNYLSAAYGYYDKALKKAYTYCKGDVDADSLENVVQYLDYAKSNILQYKESISPMDDTFHEKLLSSKLPSDDFIAMNDVYMADMDDMCNQLDYTLYILFDEYIPISSCISQIQINMDMSDLYKKYHFVCINEMLLNLSDESLSKFKTEMLPLMTGIYTGQTWLTNEDELKSQEDMIYNQLNIKINEFAVLVGEDQKDLDKLTIEYENLLQEYADIE